MEISALWRTLLGLEFGHLQLRALHHWWQQSRQQHEHLSYLCHPCSVMRIILWGSKQEGNSWKGGTQLKRTEIVKEEGNGPHQLQNHLWVAQGGRSFCFCMASLEIRHNLCCFWSELHILPSSDFAIDLPYPCWWHHWEHVVPGHQK